MENSRLIAELLALLLLAFGLGLIAVRFGQPALVGYLAAGVILGPATPGLDVPFQDVQVLADIGVVLLMFSLGVHFSYKELISLRGTVLRAGIPQVVLTLAAASAILISVGYGVRVALVLGALVAISSSTVCVKLLETAGPLDRPSARATLAVLLAQDLSVVPILAVLPALAGRESDLLPQLGQSIGSAALVLVLIPILGLRIVPWILFRIARTGSRELFLVAIMIVAFGVAVAGQQAGLSLALGAFLAGVVISESEFSQHVLGEIAPLRDLFAIVFFASIGLLVDLQGITNHLLDFVLLLALVVVAKGIISELAVRAAGYTLLTAVSSGLLLTQIGEFSFVIAAQARHFNLMSSDQYVLVLGVAIVSLFLNTALVGLASPVAAVAAQAPLRLPTWLSGHRVEPVELSTVWRGHTVVAGYGRAGRELVRALQRRGFRFVVVDLNPDRIHELREAGIEAIYGDIGNREVLSAAGIPGARVFAVTVPDPVAAHEGVLLARRLDPDLDIISRAQTNEQGLRLGEAGATEVVQPAFEVGLEFVRHTLHRFGVSMQEIQAIVSARRRDRFEEERRLSDLG